MTTQATLKTGQLILCAALASIYALANPGAVGAQNSNSRISISEGDLNHARAMHDRKGEASALYALGYAYKLNGQSEKALEFLNDALTIQHELRDLSGEAGTLTTIAEIYNDTGQPQKALEFLNHALTSERELPDRSNEADTLTVIGEVYNGMGESQKALNLLNQALPMQRETNNRRGEGKTLTAIGEVYWALGEQKRALDFYNDALPVEHQAEDRDSESVTLSDIGAFYWSAGEPQRALDFYNQALSLERLVGNRTNEAVTLNNAASAYAELGQPQKSLELYNEAVSIEHELNDLRNEAITLHATGASYQDIGQPNKALDFYNRALVIERRVSDRRAEANTLSNIGTAYRDLEERQTALTYFNQALPIEVEVGDVRAEAITLHDIGAVYAELGEPQKARDFYNQAIPLEQKAGDRLAEAYTLWRLASLEGIDALRGYLVALNIAREVGDPNLQGFINASLMGYFNEEKQVDVAIFFGKEAVNDYQQIRRNMSGLDKDLLATFVQSRADVYRRLAKLLIDEGRIPEAERVIGMLKEEETSEFLRGELDSETQRKSIPLTQPEQQAESITADELKWIGLALSNPGDKQTLDLEKKLSDENARFNEKIQAMLAKGLVQKTVLADTLVMQNILNELQDRSPNTVGVYTLVLEKEMDLIVVTRNIRLPPRTVAVSRDNLEAKVAEFRSQLEDPCSDPRTTARELYNLLIFPIAQDLKGANAKTIVWELDRGLRYVPVGALYDGEHYMVERYENVLFSFNHTDALISTVDVKNWQALGMGVSAARGGLPDLAAVPEELEGIISDPAEDRNSHGPLPGKILLDEKFTPKAMQDGIRAGFPIVHIASHFVLEPGSDQLSYLLLGAGDSEEPSGRLTVAQLSSGVTYRFNHVQLLTLSACETGTSGGARSEDGKEIDALGDLAEGKGAKSVLATLWKVNDSSTGQFMTDFYRNWTGSNGVLKVAALQQAQTNMLHHGKLNIAGPVCKESVAQPSFSHPFYWAPFILIGNWQ